MEQTPTQALATMKLGKDVVAWVVERRNSDPAPSFRTIARELEAETGVIVHDETLRLWCMSAAENGAA